MRPAAGNEAALPVSDRMVRGCWRNRLGRFVRVLRQACLQILDIPDYQGYLAHMAAHHPEKAPLSREQFVKQAIDRKYGRSGPRCC